MPHRDRPDPSPRLRRSLLAVPASSEKMAAKALGLDADAVFLDLEDAVAPDEKDAARALAVESLTKMDWRGSGKTISVRINGLATGFAEDDIARVVGGAGAGIDTVIIPKVESPEDIGVVDAMVGKLAGAGGFAPPALEALVETAAGFDNIRDIARYNDRAGGPRLEALHFGAGDYAASVGARRVDIGGLDPDYPGDPFHYPLSAIVIAARANGLVPIDSAYGDFNDAEGFEAAARRAAAIGMAGKWAIHPSQIGPANAVFSPTGEEVARARAVIEALDAAAAEGKGAVRFEDRMIDAASEKMARAVLAIHERASGRKPGARKGPGSPKSKS